jgi:hypothetical protein
LKLGFKILFAFLILFFAIAFYSFGFAHDAVCPTCNGAGEVWDRRYDFDVQTWITGYWPCPTCTGSGKIPVFSSASYSLAFFSGFTLCFLFVFALDYGTTALRLDWNPWVRDVKEMSIWFNPMYFVWLFHANRKKWAKWTTALSLTATLVCVTVLALIFLSSAQLSMARLIGQSVFLGWLIGMLLTIPFAIAWYQNYENLSRLA